MRKGDPISPLLLCLEEEVLGRLICKLVLAGSLSQIRGPNNSKVPYHLFYVEDVLIFCKGSVANIKSLIKVFKTYEAVSG